MTVSRAEEPSPISRFEVRTTAESHFSWVRTRLSLERTLMSWLRTAVSLIGFGFTIVQFFDRLQDLPSVRPGSSPQGARYLGFALILCGVGALCVSLWQYRWSVRYLWSFSAIAGTSQEGKQTPLYAITIALILVGTMTFMSLLLHLV